MKRDVLIVVGIAVAIVVATIVYLRFENRQKYCYLKSSPHEASNMWLVAYTPGVEGPSECKNYHTRKHEPLHRQIGGVHNKEIRSYV